MLRRILCSFVLIVAPYSGWAQSPQTYSEITPTQLNVFEAKLDAFLQAHGNAYASAGANAEARREADFAKIRQAVINYIGTHPGSRISSCEIVDHGYHQFHFNDRRSKLIQQEQQLIQTSINGAVEPETIAIYGGSVEPIVHQINEKALNQNHAEENYEQFKEKWRARLQLLTDHQLEVSGIKIALRHFRRWNVDKAELERFFGDELKVDLKLIEWIERTSLPDGGIAVLNNRPSADPMMDLNIAFGVLNYECGHSPAEDVQITIWGGHAPIRTLLDELKEKAPQYYNGLMLTTMFDEFQKVVNDPEYGELYKLIREKTGCGLTLNMELRKSELELQMDPPYMNSVGIGTYFIVQGWNDQTYYRIWQYFDVDGFYFRDVRKGQRGIGPLQNFIGQLRRIDRIVTEQKIHCTRATRDWDIR